MCASLSCVMLCLSALPYYISRLLWGSTIQSLVVENHHYKLVLLLRSEFALKISLPIQPKTFLKKPLPQCRWLQESKLSPSTVPCQKTRLSAALGAWSPRQPSISLILPKTLIPPRLWRQPPISKHDHRKTKTNSIRCSPTWKSK